MKRRASPPKGSKAKQAKVAAKPQSGKREAALAAKKQEEALAAKRQRAEAAEKQKAELAAAKKEAAEAVESARREAALAQESTESRTSQLEASRKAVEEATAAQKAAADAAASAQQRAQETADLAKKLQDEAEETRKVAEKAAAAAAAAKTAAEVQTELSRKQTAEAAAAQKHVQEQAARAAAQSLAADEAMRRRADEEAATLQTLKGFCKRLKLKCVDADALAVLENYFADLAAADAPPQEVVPESATDQAIEADIVEESIVPKDVLAPEPESAQIAPSGADDMPMLCQIANSSFCVSARSGSPEELSTGAAHYEGSLNQGFRLQRIDKATYKNEQGVDHGRFVVLENPENWSPNSGPATPVYLDLRHITAAVDASQDADETLEISSAQNSNALADDATKTAVTEVPVIEAPSAAAELPETAVEPTYKPDAGTSKPSAASEPAGAAPSRAAAQSEEDSFASTAAADLREFVRRLAAKQQALGKIPAEVRAAVADHAMAESRIRADEEAARPLVAKTKAAITEAKKAHEAATEEDSKAKAMLKSFEELRDAPADKVTKTAVSGQKKQLKLLGAGKTDLDALPDVLAKRASKRNKGDKKVLASIEAILEAKCQERAQMVSNSKNALQSCLAEDVALTAQSQARQKELRGSEEALKAKEAAKKACEEEVAAAQRDLASHEDRMTREGIMRFSTKTQSCLICCDDVPQEKAAMLGCGHGWYCQECVNRFVEARLESGVATDIPCPECALPISEKDLVDLLPVKTVLRLHARGIERRAVASGAIPRSCPTPNCPMRQTLEDDDVTNARQTCPMCDKESCWLCGAQPYHEGRTCEQHAKLQRKKGQRKAEESFMKWMEETGSKQCPTCGMATTKEVLESQHNQRIECHKMLCRNCGCKFCFKCCAVLTDDYTCGCTKDFHNFVDPHNGELVKHLKPKRR